MSVDVAGKKVVLEDGDPVPYDFLILATGATHSYFGHDEFKPFAPGLKTVDEALLIRQRIYMAYEEAEREEDEAKKKALLTFIVVGAGPTGVEMAGALAEIARETLTNEFRRIDPDKARVILVEGGDRILSSYTPDLSAHAVKSLEKLRVDIRVNTRVTKVDEEGVMIGEKRIRSRTVIWAAGVAASPLARSLAAPLDNVGRVKVTPELSIPGHDEVYVIGDLARVEQEGGTIVPGVAQGAMQGAAAACKNIMASINGIERGPYRYKDRGNMATIGRAAAIADLGFTKLWGFIAWLAWLALHVLLLIGFRNRVIVMVQWAFAYISFDRGSRLIHGMVHPKAAEPVVLPSKRGAEIAKPL
jgi:NADH dehydrogenase